MREAWHNFRICTVGMAAAGPQYGVLPRLIVAPFCHARAPFLHPLTQSARRSQPRRPSSTACRLTASSCSRSSSTAGATRALPARSRRTDHPSSTISDTLLLAGMRGTPTPLCLASCSAWTSRLRAPQRSRSPPDAPAFNPEYCDSGYQRTSERKRWFGAISKLRARSATVMQGKERESPL